MNTICDRRGDNERGIIPEIIWNFLILSMNLSTWILDYAISFVFKTSSLVNFSRRSKNGGITSVAPLVAQMSWIVKPRSPRTTSPIVSFSMKFDCFTICRSEIEPSYTSLTNMHAPDGATPIRTWKIKAILHYQNHWKFHPKC